MPYVNWPLTNSQRSISQTISRGPRALSRERPCNDKLNWVTIASGSNTANNRKACWSPANSAITDIQIGFPGFHEGQPEADNPIAYTASAYVEYPAGTFTRAYCVAGSTLTVTPGRQTYWFDPVPVVIPKNTQYWVKWFMSWTGSSVDMPLSVVCAGVNGEWCEVGVGLTDQAGTSSVRTHSYPAPTQATGLGFQVSVRARTAAWLPIVGILGDSISQGSGERGIDPVYGGSSFERAFRNACGVTNVSRQSEQFTDYTGRRDGRTKLLRDNVTHLMVNYGRNDLSNGASSATIQARLQSVVAQWLNMGVPCYAITLTPITTSSDSWATTANQTVASAPQEAQRVAYNTWLRANWKSIGLSGIFDVAWAVDPTDTGKWGADGTAGERAIGVATLTGNAITAIARATLSAGTAYGGASYPLSAASHPLVIYPYPDDPIQTGGGAGTCATDGSGVVTGYTVTSGGVYTIPPLIAPRGRWTTDGIHPSNRGMNEIIYHTGLSASAFYSGMPLPT